MSDTTLNDFVGVGLSFPMRWDPSGGLALSRGESEITEAVRLVLGTAMGERPMRPDFGCRIHDMVFDSADAGLGGIIAYEVRSSLTRWEPRIRVVSVEVTFDPDERTTAYIAVSYVVSDTNNPRNLVYPFYFIPSDDAATEGGQS